MTQTNDGGATDLTTDALKRLAARLEGTPLYEGSGEESSMPEEAAQAIRELIERREADGDTATPTAQKAEPTEDELDEAWKSGFNAGFGEAKLTAHPPQPSVSGAEDALCSEILAELTRARAKFPGKNVTFAALVEEVGELVTATFEESADRVRKEAVQVAVMAMRMILDGDHCYEPWRAEKGLDPLDPALRALKGGAA